VLETPRLSPRAENYREAVKDEASTRWGGNKMMPINKESEV
jgi:hypothetical protein